MSQSNMITTAQYMQMYKEREDTDLLQGRQVLEESVLQEIQDEADSFFKIIQNLCKEFKGFQPCYDENQDEGKKEKIFRYFPLAYLAKEDQFLFVEHLYSLKNKEKNYIGNKVLSNLKDPSYRLPMERFETLYYNPKINTPLAQLYQAKIKKYKKIIEKECYIHPMVLRDMVKLGFGIAQKKEVESVLPLCHIVVESLMSALEFWVMTQEAFNYSQRLKSLEKMEAFLDDFMKKLPKNSGVGDTDLDSTITFFVDFLTYRTHYKEIVRASQSFGNETTEEAETLRTVEEMLQEYKAHGKLNASELDHQAFRSILNAKKDRLDAVTKKLDFTRKTIEVLAEAGHNFDLNSVIHQKIVYHTLFTNKQTDKNAPSTLAIAKKWVNNGTKFGVSISDQLFLQEQLKREYVRQFSPNHLCERYEKVRLKLYLSVIENFLTYDLDAICYHLTYLFTEGLELCSAPLFARIYGQKVENVSV